MRGLHVFQDPLLDDKCSVVIRHAQFVLLPYLYVLYAVADIWFAQTGSAKGQAPIINNLLLSHFPSISLVMGTLSFFLV